MGWLLANFLHGFIQGRPLLVQPFFFDLTELRFRDLVPLRDDLIGAADRGSHVLGRHKVAEDVTPLLQIDDGRLLNQLAVWAPDAATRKLILVDNPARLYQF